MSKIKEAIEKAVEKGFGMDRLEDGYIIKRFWSPDALTSLRVEVERTDGIDDYIDLPEIEKIIIDPKFWKALGEYENWDYIIEGTKWLEYWHELINHLADGGDIETYFEEIL